MSPRRIPSMMIRDPAGQRRAGPRGAPSVDGLIRATRIARIEVARIERTCRLAIPFPGSDLWSGATRHAGCRAGAGGTARQRRCPSGRASTVSPGASGRGFRPVTDMDPDAAAFAPATVPPRPSPGLNAGTRIPGAMTPRSSIGPVIGPTGCRPVPMRRGRGSRGMGSRGTRHRPATPATAAPRARSGQVRLMRRDRRRP